ncbi:hypothetical protein EUX98_g6823, partial [Antrodiella citrinella]
MSLLSPAETLAFNGFLSSVDYTDVLDSEWSALSSQLAPPRGKEALTKATKDLMSLEPQLHDSPSTSTRPTLPSPSPSPSPPPSASSSSPKHKSRKMQTATASAPTSASSIMNAWPPFASPSDPSSHHHHSLNGYHHRYTYGFGTPSHTRTDFATTAHRLSGLYANPFDTAVHGLPLPYPHTHTESSLRHRAASITSPSPTSSTQSHFALPPLPDYGQQHHSHSHSPTYSNPDSGLQQHQSRPQHPGITSVVSAPSVLSQRPSATTKRSLPTDNDSDASSGTTSQHLKRQRRPSTTPSADGSTPSTPSQLNPPAGQRQALLSPSQKRANHIQSEQKRRANIRRGYEALCEVVPALREAIRAEEESLAAAEEEKASFKSRGSSRKKGKGKAAKDDGPAALDGRAGPRSENVVLQQ